MTNYTYNGVPASSKLEELRTMPVVTAEQILKFRDESLSYIQFLEQRTILPLGDHSKQ